jgi:uncharacterized protein
MILEGLITTTSADGSPHLAPMGPRVSEDMCTFLLRPFPTSTTYQNLRRHGEGVLHVTDDVLLLAKAAVGKVEAFPEHRAATGVGGYVLCDTCRYFEFRVRSIDDTEQRVRIDCEVVKAGTVREFFGFNRAKHAVLEAAIFATRFRMLPTDEVDTEFRKLRVIVDKTAGPRELEAMAFLEREWADYKARAK